MIHANMDAGSVLKLWGEMEHYYSSAWRKMEDAQSLYDHRFPWLKDRVPEGVDIHEPSTASSIIDHFRDNVRVQNIVPSRDDWGTSQEARAKKALLLRLDKYIIDKFREQGQVDAFTQTIFDMSLRGAAAWQLGFNKRLWPEQPDTLPRDEAKRWRDERGMNWPVWVHPIDPLAIAPAPGGEFPMPWCLVKHTMTAQEASRRWPGWTNKRHLRPDTVLTIVEAWSAPGWEEDGQTEDGYHKVVCDSELVEDVVNPFGFVPFVFEYSGMGRVNYDGDPAALAVNMIEKASSELIAEARMRTAADAIWQFTAYPRLLTTEDPRTVRIKWDLSSGGILQVMGLAPDQRPQWLEQPQMDTAMWSFLPMVMRSIERSTFSSVLEGQRTPGVDFGYLQALLVGQASLRKDNIIGMAGRMFARAVGLAERMLVNLDIGPIVLGPGTEGEKTRSVSAADIGNRFDLDVVIEASDPAERDRRMLAWATPLRAGAISKRTYLQEGLMRDDPDEELAEVYAEAAIEQIVRSGVLAEQLLGELSTGRAEKNIADMTSQLQQQVARSTQEAAPSKPPGVPPEAASPVAESPLSVVKSMQSVNQRASSLRTRA